MAVQYRINPMQKRRVRAVAASAIDLNMLARELYSSREKKDSPLPKSMNNGRKDARSSKQSCRFNGGKGQVKSEVFSRISFLGMMVRVG
jgi:hypothetical protein